MTLARLLVPTSLPLSGSELYGGLFWPLYLFWLGSEILNRRRAVGRCLRIATFAGLVCAFACAINAPATAFAGKVTPFYAGLALMLAGLAIRRSPYAGRILTMTGVGLALGTWLGLLLILLVLAACRLKNRALPRPHREPSPWSSVK